LAESQFSPTLNWTKRR